MVVAPPRAARYVPMGERGERQRYMSAARREKFGDGDDRTLVPNSSVEHLGRSPRSIASVEQLGRTAWSNDAAE